MRTKSRFAVAVSLEVRTLDTFGMRAEPVYAVDVRQQGEIVSRVELYSRFKLRERFGRERYFEIARPMVAFRKLVESVEIQNGSS